MERNLKKMQLNWMSKLAGKMIGIKLNLIKMRLIISRDCYSRLSRVENNNMIYYLNII